MIEPNLFVKKCFVHKHCPNIDDLTVLPPFMVMLCVTSVTDVAARLLIPHLKDVRDCIKMIRMERVPGVIIV